MFHFLLECPNYIEQRRNMLVRLAFYTADIKVDLLLNGSENLSVDHNIDIFRNVMHFISSSNRFE